ncbi:AIR carboxylase family protein [Microbulbifer sp. THAF38]|nr:AIR carboxylase family protein [Microbulbifer sp. THAF38]
MSKPFVAILMGSGFDLPVVETTFAVLDKCHIQHCNAN